MNTDKYVEELWNSDVVPCLDALKEADEAVTTINRDMFDRILRVGQNVLDDDGGLAVVRRTLSSFEKKYKKERGVKHMPGSYRSAKSVVINAIRSNLYLQDGPGGFKGKTALEREIRQAKKPQVKSGTADRRPSIDKAFDEVHQYLIGLYPSPLSDPNDNVREWCAIIQRDLDEIRKTYGV